MKLLSLDPSSTCTGYALFKKGELGEFGLLKPSKRYDAWERIKIIVEDVRSLIRIHKCDRVIIEVGKKPHGSVRQQSMGAGLIVYGMALGAVCLAVAESLESGRCEHVDANAWTRKKRKADRIAELAMYCPRYEPAKDPGGDAADAIDMGVWWLQDKRIRSGGDI